MRHSFTIDVRITFTISGPQTRRARRLLKRMLAAGEAMASMKGLNLRGDLSQLADIADAYELMGNTARRIRACQPSQGD
jgi:hypothetical protein